MSTPDPGQTPDIPIGPSNDTLEVLQRFALEESDPRSEPQETAHVNVIPAATHRRNDHWEPPSIRELAAELPAFEIEALLGRGGMGAVFKGVQKSLDRCVAIKILPRAMADDDDFVARFRREARTLARLKHRGIVTAYDSGQTSGGYLWFSMEHVDGVNLQQVLHAAKGLAPEKSLEMVGEICDALQYAHAQGVIHRDIKPANVLISRNGLPMLADFGLSRPAEAGSWMTRTNMVMGTPDYMAPEQKRGHADCRSDIYSMGAMLYEMLTGHVPHGAWEPPSRTARVDPRLDGIISKALQREPEKRYQTVSELKSDISEIKPSDSHSGQKGAVDPGHPRAVPPLLEGIPIAGRSLVVKSPFDPKVEVSVPLADWVPGHEVICTATKRKFVLPQRLDEPALPAKLAAAPPH